MAPDPRSELRRLARERCIPVTVTLEITLACNLRCPHCYNFDRAGSAPAIRPLGDDEIRDAIDQVRDAGALTMILTGGEALAHPSLDAFVAHAASRRMEVVVKSNGTALAARARRLADAGCRRVDVSLYGGTAGTHDAFTGVPGSFGRTRDGIDAARAAGLAVGVSVPLTRTNAHEVETILALGLPCSIDPQITRRVDGDAAPLHLRVDREMLARLYAGPLREMAPSPCFDGGVQCNCARSVCGIGANGDVYPCIGAPWRAGNLRERPFAEIWRESPVFERIRALTLDDFAACKPCPDRPWCRRSSGTVYMNTGDYTGAEPWTCMEANVLRGLTGT